MENFDDFDPRKVFENDSEPRRPFKDELPNDDSDIAHLTKSEEFWDIEPDEETVTATSEIEDDGLIFNEEFGIRWKNGSYDRRVRGDRKKEVKLKYYGNPRTFVTAAKTREFIDRYVLMYESVQELLVKNSLIVESIKKGDVMFYSTVMGETMEAEFADVTNEDFRYFMRRVNLGMMHQFIPTFNLLATAVMYAKFKGMKEMTVRQHIARGKFELFTIAGTRFIVVQEEDMLLWNAFLMEEAGRNENCENRPKLAETYGNLYGDELPTPPDSVKDFFASRCMYPTNVDGECWKEKKHTAGAYILYEVYCDEVGIEPVPIRTFALRITEMGFKRFNGRKRGFYYWKGDEK